MMPLKISIQVNVRGKMKTEHSTIFSDSGNMKELAQESTDLVVTSPPYPMIEMWDKSFADQDPSIEKCLIQREGLAAFEKMHTLMDRTWKEVYRILKPGGFACINIGDATRTLNGNFCLYPNHSRILAFALELGFSPLPCILWRKQTNAPNKFMGSGMLPAGAYVTLEHEYILILRKGGKREFKGDEEKALRRESALFWEERNLWFSDLWFDIKGRRQALADKETRKRSAAFPFELAHRLINMYSVKGDLVVDPFLGMGTTAMAAMTAARNSVGYEIDPGLENANGALAKSLIPKARQTIDQRLSDHIDFVAQRMDAKGPLNHRNQHYGFPVMTAQEKQLLINVPLETKMGGENRTVVTYDEAPQEAFCRDWPEAEAKTAGTRVGKPSKKMFSDGQMSLF